MKFDKLYRRIIESDEKDEAPHGDELKMGVEVEKEHTDLLNKFKDFCTKNNVHMPLTDEEFFETIAKAHLREFPQYYTHLKQMEASMKK